MANTPGEWCLPYTRCESLIVLKGFYIAMLTRTQVWDRIRTRDRPSRRLCSESCMARVQRKEGFGKSIISEATCSLCLDFL